MTLPILEIVLPKDKPYLVLGKGPTFQNIYKYNLDDYYIVCLNETAELIECYFAHFIDSECLSGKMLKNAQFIICPVFPHINNRATNSPAVAYFLRYANFDLSRVYNYNCSTWKRSPIQKYGRIIKAKYFSSEAVFRILAYLGVKQIHTLGIDGGNIYAPQFNHLKPLINGRKTFNEQFGELNKIIQKWEMKWTRLS